MLIKNKIVALTAFAGLLACMVAGGSYALAQTTHQGADTAGTGQRHHKEHRKGYHGGGQAIRGQAVVRDGSAPGGFATVAFARGHITAASGDGVSIKEADGTTARFSLDRNTKVRIGDKQASAADLKAGMQAKVTTKQVSGGQPQVERVHARDKSGPSGSTTSASSS